MLIIERTLFEKIFTYLDHKSVASLELTCTVLRLRSAIDLWTKFNYSCVYSYIFCWNPIIKSLTWMFKGCCCWDQNLQKKISMFDWRHKSIWWRRHLSWIDTTKQTLQKQIIWAFLQVKWWINLTMWALSSLSLFLLNCKSLK